MIIHDLEMIWYVKIDAWFVDVVIWVILVSLWKMMKYMINYLFWWFKLF
jgi:hypothetical protein